jgi:hypothetical protein
MLPSKMPAAQTLKMWLPFLRRRKPKALNTKLKQKKTFCRDSSLVFVVSKAMLAIPSEFGVKYFVKKEVYV